MMETIRFKLNGRPVRIEVDGDRTLLVGFTHRSGRNRTEIRLRRRVMRRLHGAGQ